MSKFHGRPYLEEQVVNREKIDNDTFRAIGAEVVKWLEAKKPLYTKEIVE